MENIRVLAEFRRIPVYIFSNVDLKNGEVDEIFVTIDLPSLFECVRHYMSILQDAARMRNPVFFSFETRLLSPIEINKLSLEIGKKNQERMKKKNLEPPPPEPKLAKVIHFPYREK